MVAIYIWTQLGNYGYGVTSLVLLYHSINNVTLQFLIDYTYYIFEYTVQFKSTLTSWIL